MIRTRNYENDKEMQEVALVGPKIAERIRELVGGEYKG